MQRATTSTKTPIPTAEARDNASSVTRQCKFDYTLVVESLATRLRERETIRSTSKAAHLIALYDQTRGMHDKLAPDNPAYLETIGRLTRTIIDECTPADTGGLVNRGNTCYMNVVLHLLYAIPDLRTAILSYGRYTNDDALDKIRVSTSSKAQNTISTIDATVCGGMGMRSVYLGDTWSVGDVMLETIYTFQRMHDITKQTPHDPIHLVHACSNLGLSFRPTAQNDAHEFFTKIIEQFEQFMKADPSGRCTHLLANCFDIHARKMETCDNCKSRTASPKDTLRMLPVIVERQSDDVRYDQSLEECLRETYMTHETMQGDAMVDCDCCRSRTPTTVTTSICKSPQVSTPYCICIY